MSTRMTWHDIGDREFETGLSNGVLYPLNNGEYGPGVPWNGLISVSESPTGAEPQAHYADNIKYLNLMSTEEFEATIEAYTYPKEFEKCDGSYSLADGVYIGQQTRQAFGMSYRTVVGNDVDSDAGYKLHLIYGALASPSEKTYNTINDTPEAITFSWSVTTTPVEVPDHKPTASITLDSTKVDPATLKKIEDILYDAEDARLPLPEELMEILNAEGNTETVSLDNEEF